MYEEKIKKVLETISKSGITVAGDLVLEKSVQYEVNNVEDGGIGIQIINDKDTPLAQTYPPVPNTPEATNRVAKPPKLDNNIPESKLILLLSRDWFNECSTDTGLYTPSWRSKYVKALMKEFGTNITQGWVGTGTRNKQDLIKGHVLGALKNAGVIKGGYSDIARKALNVGVAPTEKEAKKLASYMGHPQGDDESTQNPYRDWTEEYVEDTQ